MKKSRKPKAAPRPAPSSPGSKPSQKPPIHVIHEMAALLNTGQLEILEQKAKAAIHHWPEHFIGWKALGILRLMQGRHADALQTLANNVKLTPHDAQAHQNLGSALLGLERFEEAEASYRQALTLNPGYVQAHTNLGITLMNLGRLAEAEACYRQALALDPDFVEARNNLGNILKDMARFAEAETHFRQALTQKPDFAEAHHNLGNVLMELNRLAEAESCYQLALKLKTDYLQAHIGLGAVLLKLGRLVEALASYRQALAIDASAIQAHDGLNQTLSRLTPMWHVPMMNDHMRNDAYFEALRAAVTPASHVLEIGTGSGLLAMMAAKLGARQVTTCEAVPSIAETARAIVADNGFTPPITVLSKLSTKMEIGVDMADRADLLVSEILSSEFLGEGVVSSIEDAKRRLLKPGARIIPARGAIQCALFGGDDIRQNVRVDEVYGFDLSRFNAIVPPKQYISRNDLDIELLTDDTTAFFFDFQETARIPRADRKLLEMEVRTAGRCCGVIQWLRLEMDDTIVFENHPAMKNPASSWQHCVFIFPTSIDVLPGQVALISATHNRITPWFFFEGMK
ncbi:MAG: tetratricopeptide repeat protein [Proteobacteria bacterium]|nr:tetratricopeptide repeat protein [Pseudomonadota bacterium]MBU1641003.1 tetratricopeptide repeat protein [Pseudomonadota bacterium]